MVGGTGRGGRGRMEARGRVEDSGFGLRERIKEKCGGTCINCGLIAPSLPAHRKSPTAYRMRRTRPTGCPS